MATGEAPATEIVENQDFGFEPGVWCEKCNKRLVELKRQTLKLILPELHNVIQLEGSLHRGSRLATRIYDQLRVPDTELKSWKDNRCDVCSTNVSQLKNEALSMVQTLEDSRLLVANIPRLSSSPPGQSSNQRSQVTTPSIAEAGYNHAVNFPPRYGYMAYGHDPAPVQVPLSVFARAAYKLRKKQKKAQEKSQKQAEMTATNPSYSNGSSASPEPSVFTTNFCNAIRRYPPPSPPGLIKGLSKRRSTGGKVKVLLRICPSFPGETSSFLKVDQKKKQVTLYDPNAVGHVSQKYKRMGVAAPKMFAFDSIFEPDTSQAEICGTALTEVLQSVVSGSDGCVFSYGHAGLGKTYTMIGRDENIHTLGVASCSIAWLFRLIDEKREKTGARFSVRVSAVEVVGRSENLRDLLQEQSSADGNDATQGTKPSVYLYDDPVSGPQLLNHSELRASTPEKAAFYLDAALTSRTVANNDKDPEEALNSHMFFTIHVYQSRVDKIAGKMGVHGGRSRLHLVDLASCERFSATKKETSCSSMSLNGLGNVIIALINGAKHVPHKDSTLTRLLRESLGSTTCRVTMIGHISPSIPFYSESLSCVQFAARIHRLRRKKGKGSGTSSSGGESSCDETRMRKPRIRTSALSESLREGCSGTSDYTSSTGEESCDTVIYVGPDGQISDRELTDNEGPSHMAKESMRSEGIKVNTALKKKLENVEHVSDENRCNGNEGMELEYDLTAEFKGNIEKVPERGSVENLTISKKKKVNGNERCDFWEDPLCTKVSQTSKNSPNVSQKFTEETAVKETVEAQSATGPDDDHFKPIKETISKSEGDLTSGNNLDDDDDELSHSPALDTPLTTFYYLVPDPSVNEAANQGEASTSETPACQGNQSESTPSAPPSPTSNEVRSILENYVVDQMLIKNSSHPEQATRPNVQPEDPSECLVPPLMPQKACVSGTAQISATSPKRKIPEKRAKTFASGDRQYFSDVGENRSDTQSEDSYGSTKTDPLHYIKTPRRGVKSSLVNHGSLPREYKVIIRDKASRVRYLGCEKEAEKGYSKGRQISSHSGGLTRSPCKGVQLKYCGFEENKECEARHPSDCPPKSPSLSEESKRTPLTITSRATFGFNFGSLKKPTTENGLIKAGEPYGPHQVVSRNNKEKLMSTTNAEAIVNSENDSPKHLNNSLDVPRQRSKLKLSRRDSGQGYSSGIASDGSMTDSPLSKSPVARRRRRLGSTKSEISSSGYESMRDGSGTTCHVSGSDSASEKGVFVDGCRPNGGTRQHFTFSERDNGVDNLDHLRLRGIEEVGESPYSCATDSLLDIHKWRIITLRTKQVELRKELEMAKSRLLLEGKRWSFHLESQNMTLDDPNLIQVLENENKRLQRRIKVCKSRVMLVTSFDILPQRSKL